MNNRNGLGRRLISQHTREVPAVDLTFQGLLEEAELCCEHARSAARLKRYEASRGLFITAAALYQRAVKAAGSSYPSIENRLREIEVEMAAYSELARSMARPLLPSTTGSLRYSRSNEAIKSTAMLNAPLTEKRTSPGVR